MHRRLALIVALCLGCNDGRTGGRYDNIPLPGMSYSARHTYPLVARAAIAQHRRLGATELAVVHAFDLNSSDISLEKIVASEVADATIAFIPRAQISQRAEQYINTKDGTPAWLWSITGIGGTKHLLRFRVDCNSGTVTDSYEVTLQATEGSKDWSVGPVKQL